MPMGQLGLVSASGAAGAGGGAAGGSWLLAGPLGAKLAVACLLALGLGAGCVVLETGHGRAGPPPRVHESPHAFDLPMGDGGLAGGSMLIVGASPGRRSALSAATVGPVSPGALTRPSPASREFGPEGSQGSGGGQSSSSRGLHGARMASTRAASSGSPSPLPAAGAGPAAARAEREFTPG
jgi:hypothetical protein